MVYKEFKDKRLSALGMGAMRLPVIDGNDAKIDEAAVQTMVDYAIDHGINYFDTAWGYHNGNSELAMGRALARHPRDKFYLADKFPGYDLGNMDKVKTIFPKQLEKCGVDYFDFYLFHNVCEVNIDAYLDNKKYGVRDYLVRMRDEGKIEHLGFSVHGSYDVMKRFLDAYGKDVEFCQIQLNYIDYDFQDAKAKIELCKQYGLPVWVMEPLRGGRLATLPPEQTDALKKLRPDETVPAWAFRFIQTIPTVGVTLSGMSNFEQLKANIETFDTDKPLVPAEWDALISVGNYLTSASTVPCTACRYCTSHCPQGLDIPSLLSLYNEHAFTKGGFLAPMALSALPQEKQPSACLNCKSCEAVCPQQIKISNTLADFVNRLN